MQMVRKYVLEPAGTNDAVGTGGTAAFSYLHEHISDTEAARVSVLKEGPTTPKSVRRSPGGHCPFFAAGRDAADAGEGLLVTNDDDLLWRVDAADERLPNCRRFGAHAPLANGHSPRRVCREGARGCHAEP